MAASPTPDFTVDDDAKKAIAAHMVPGVMQALRDVSVDQVATADDILDVLAFCIAAVLENDTHITTPKHTKQAMETIETFVKRRARQLRDDRQSLDAPSFLARAVDQYRKDQAAFEQQLYGAGDTLSD